MRGGKLWWPLSRQMLTPSGCLDARTMLGGCICMVAARQVLRHVACMPWSTSTHRAQLSEPCVRGLRKLWVVLHMGSRHARAAPRDLCRPIASRRFVRLRGSCHCMLWLGRAA